MKQRNPRLQTVVSFLERLGSLLIEPPPSVDEADRRRQARLLATTVLVMITVLSLGVGLVWLVSPSSLFSGNLDLILGIAVVAALVIAYALTRSTRYTIATIVAVVGLEVGIFATTVLGWMGASPYYGTEDVNFLIYTVVPILFASLLLSARALFGIILLNAVVTLVLPLFFAQIALADVILGPFIFSFGVSALVLLVTRQRNRLETDRRAELTRQKERYQSLFDRVPVGLYRVSPGGRILDANRALVRLLGHRDRARVLTLNAFDLFVDPEARKQELALLEKEGVVRAFEIRMQRSDGEIIWVQDTCRAIRDEDGQLQYYEGGLEDITKRREVEEALRESEERFRNIFENAPIGIYRTSPDGEILMANPALVTMLGYDSFAELRRRNLAKTGFHPDHPRSEFRQRVERAGRFIGLESAWETKDGSTLFVRENARVVRDRTGNVLYYEGTVEDITERKKMQERLRRQERLAVVGQMAGGIAHDFRNFLTSIILYAQIPLRKPGLPPELSKNLETVVSEARRAADLVQQILDFSRRSVMETELVDLAEITQRVADILRKTVPENIDLKLELTSEPCVTEADPTRIQQILMNLALNARDAMPQGGQLRIAVARREIDPGSEPLADMSPGRWLSLTVSDTGTGMPQEVRDHLFEPFFTTKEPGEGTGLGLAQVYGIVKQHRGHVDVETAVGEGTTFTVYLPVHGEAERASIEESADLPRGKGEVVLLAEDEERVRSATRDILESLGYRVLEAVNGREALERAREASVDLLLTDLVMPEMGGRELIQSLREEHADIKAVVMTGYAADDDFTDLAVEVVHKPLDLERLARMVRRSVDGASEEPGAG